MEVLLGISTVSEESEIESEEEDEYSENAVLYSRLQQSSHVYAEEGEHDSLLYCETQLQKPKHVTVSDRVEKDPQNGVTELERMEQDWHRSTEVTSS